jgi:hypothetical protein
LPAKGRCDVRPLTALQQHNDNQEQTHNDVHKNCGVIKKSHKRENLSFLEIKIVRKREFKPSEDAENTLLVWMR